MSTISILRNVLMLNLHYVDYFYFKECIAIVETSNVEIFNSKFSKVGPKMTTDFRNNFILKKKVTIKTF